MGQTSRVVIIIIIIKSGGVCLCNVTGSELVELLVPGADWQKRSSTATAIQLAGVYRYPTLGHRHHHCSSEFPFQLAVRSSELLYRLAFILIERRQLLFCTFGGASMRKIAGRVT